jgi:hypothetical protein
MQFRKTSLIAALSIAALMSACTLFEEAAKETDNKSATSLSSSSSNSGTSSSSSFISKNLKDSLLQLAQEDFGAEELQMIQSLNEDCQAKYLSMSYLEDPTVFFEDTQCVESVALGMAPEGLSTECKTLYTAPFNYYSKNWEKIEECFMDDKAECQTIMGDLNAKTDAFYDKCDGAEVFPWEGSGNTDTTMSLEEFCADPMNAQTQECIQFLECDPLFGKLEVVQAQFTVDMAKCAKDDMECQDLAYTKFSTDYEEIDADLNAAGCYDFGSEMPRKLLRKH